MYAYGKGRHCCGHIVPVRGHRDNTAAHQSKMLSGTLSSRLLKIVMELVASAPPTSCAVFLWKEQRLKVTVCPWTDAWLRAIGVLKKETIEERYRHPMVKQWLKLS